VSERKIRKAFEIIFAAVEIAIACIATMGSSSTSSTDDDDALSVDHYWMDVSAPYLYLAARLVLALAVVWFSSGASK